MLKIVKASLAITVSTFVFSNVAHADVNEALANICTIVQADDKGELRKKMRSVQSDFNLKLRDYYAGITCDGQSLIRTALTSNANEVGTLLVKNMPSKDLQAPEADWVNCAVPTRLGQLTQSEAGASPPRGIKGGGNRPP